jgi:hypothetical protein
VHLCGLGEASYGLERESMADRINTVPVKKPETETPTVVNDESNPSETGEKKMEKIANKAAHKAAKTEQQFDEGHTTFSNV